MVAESTSPEHSEETSAVQAYQRLLAFGGLCLIAASWILWIPQSGYPQIPWFAWGCAIPTWSDWLCLGLITLSLIGLLLPRLIKKQNVVCWCVLFLSLGFSCLLDQHRFQPWAYQLLIVSVVMMCRPPKFLPVLQILVLSIYFFSGISKLDYSFCHDLGQVFLTTLFRFIQLPNDFFTEATMSWLALMFPIGELIVFLLLLFQKSRKLGVIAALVMHLILIAVVGPWGLGHQYGVLLWNIIFMAQACLLFWPQDEPGQTESSNETSAPRQPLWSDNLAFVVIGFVVVLPFTEALGRFDHWPAWALYASHVSRTELFVNRLAEDLIPEQLKPFTKAVPGQAQLVRIDIADWSLQTVGVPAYPQARYETAVALAIAEKYQLEGFIQLVVFEQADRFTGKREKKVIYGKKQIEEESKHYFFNLKSRDL